MTNADRLVEIHIVQARLRALRLVAFTGAVFPGEWSDQWNEAIVPDLLEFGFHARKVNEFCNLMEVDFPPIDTKVVKMSEGDPGNWERSYRNALNALMHMKTFTIGMRTQIIEESFLLQLRISSPPISRFQLIASQK